MFNKLFNKKRKLPKVVINDERIERDLGKWFCCKRNIAKEFGKVLLELGFSSDDEIILCKYNEVSKTFTYIVNERNPYKKNSIGLIYGFDTGEAKIILTTGSKKTRTRTVYKCGRDVKRKLDMNFLVTCYDKEVKNGIFYRRFYCSDDAKFYIQLDDYELEIIIGKPYLETSKEMYSLRNEKELVNYLNTLIFPVKIDELYKKVCEISLGEDVSKYSYINLNLTKFNEDTMEIDELTDIIEIVEGRLLSFGITRNGKKVFLEQDGTWSYSGMFDNSSVLMHYQSDEETYKFEFNNVNSEDYSESDDLVRLKNSADKEITDVKRLVKKMFNIERI